MVNVPDQDTLEIEGAAHVVDGRVMADANWKWIDELVASRLVKVAGGGWETLYRDRVDDRLWELDYPEGSLHGGGPPRLRRLSEDDARAKYGDESCGSLSLRTDSQ
jgi:hypothetical protein